MVTSSGEIIRTPLIPTVPEVGIDAGLAILASLAVTTALGVRLAAIERAPPFFDPACSVFFAPQAKLFPISCAQPCNDKAAT